MRSQAIFRKQADSFMVKADFCESQTAQVIFGNQQIFWVDVAAAAKDLPVSSPS